MPSSHRSAYDQLGVRPVINACGIYTDLGGSCLSEAVWSALATVNGEWASIPELLDASGARIANLVGAEAARVAPGASACIALGVAACIAGRDGDLNERLPDVDLPRRTVLLQEGHRYKYARCALLAGAKVRESRVESPDRLSSALTADVAGILHPVHLDGRDGTLPLAEVLEVARPRGVPVIVDAAYLSYPTELIARWVGTGADLVCFSAKYFHGPNAGGFMAGRQDLIEAVAELDFTHFEAGPRLTFGRPFKLDRTAIVGTVLALEEWLSLDHEKRWRGYAERVQALAERLSAGPSTLTVEQRQFTLDERLVDAPVNALVLVLDSAAQAAGVEDRLAEGDPRIFCVPMENRLVFCVETVRPDQDDALASRILASLERSPTAG
jgi:D-glucosaminate-6-phosphate ammonia-lyase